ncbi:hypothetical protein AGMMS49975_25920 [Clostridia bacterium]|nr:hypothetical protein AGMMS49975_25920 [Clostridia bacterium]
MHELKENKELEMRKAYYALEMTDSLQIAKNYPDVDFTQAEKEIDGVLVSLLGNTSEIQRVAVLRVIIARKIMNTATLHYCETLIPYKS